MNPDQRIQFLSEVNLFQSLDREPLVPLAEGAEEREYNAGKLLYEQGDPANELWIVVDGSVEITVTDEAGTEQVINTLRRPEAFGEAALYDEGDRMVSARAAEMTRVLVIDGERFRALVREQAAVGETLLRLMASRLRMSSARK